MAAQQIKRHALGRLGEAIAQKMFGGKKTKHTAPFDLVDFTAQTGYEIKTMSAYSRDLKIHISDHSMARKQAFAKEYGLKMVLIAMVIYDEKHVEVYSGELKQSMRVAQMEQIAK